MMERTADAIATASISFEVDADDKSRHRDMDIEPEAMTSRSLGGTNVHRFPSLSASANATVQMPGSSMDFDEDEQINGARLSEWSDTVL